MLDAGRGAVAAGAVVGVGGDVADAVDVVQAGDLEGLVGAEGAVLFERGRAFGGLEEVGGGGDADAEDDEVGVKDGAVFEVDSADVGGVAGRGRGFFDAGFHVEFDAVFFQEGFEDVADLFAHDAFEGGFFHADDGDGVCFREAVGDFHPDEGAADHDDLLTFVADCSQDTVHVGDGPQEEDVVELLEAWERKHLGRSPHGEDELGVGVTVARFRRDFSVLEIYSCNLVRLQINSS